MPRAKIKKTKVTTGQRDISSFFSPQKQKDSTCSTKFTTLIKTEAQVDHGETSPSRVLSLSPSTRSILGVIENLAPSSPELLLSVPETPESQIRPTSSSSPRDPGKSGQLSPLCQTPRSRRLNLRRVMTKEGRSGSPKRLLSSPEESHNAKRPRSTSTHALKPVTSDSPTMNALKVTRPATAPLNKPCFPSAHIKSNGQSERSEGQGLGLSFSGANQAVFSDSRKEVTSLKAVSVTEDSPQSLGEPRRCQEERAQDEEEPVFTVMAEQTHTHSSLDADKHTKADTHSLDTHMHKPNTNTAAVASQISVKEGEVSVDGEEATAPAVTSVDQDRVAGTSLAQDGAGGITSCACPIEDELEDHWFEEQMDPGLVKEQKHTDTPRKVPDHVILCGGLNNRYWVLNVEEGPAHKVLTISCSKTLHPTETCLLKDGCLVVLDSGISSYCCIIFIQVGEHLYNSPETSPVSSGDVVHLEGRCDGGSWLVDREQGFLVLLPDRLVSGTSISSSIRCMRCAVLGDMFKSFDGGSKQMLNGTMVHEVFQKAAMAKDFSMETLSNLADKVLFSPQHLGLMYSLGVSQEEMKQELYDYMPSLKQWADEYLTSSKPKTISLKVPRSGGAPSSCKDSLDTIVTVTELVDIEENMWSPRFGLKGKIDVTAQVRIHRTRNANRSAPQERIMPLELKTGKETNAIEHRSQVILYTLMSMERHTYAEAGFLLYLKTGNLHPVVAGHMDRRELLKLRNTLVHHLGNPVEKWEGKSRLSRLPDILTNRHCCQYCPQRRNCALYERVMESSSSDNVSQDSVHDFLIQETGHLTPPHLNYFSHWLLLCCLESITMENKNSRKHVWLKTAEEREKTGGCVGNLQLIGPVIVQSEAVFLHQFQRRGVAFQEEASSGLADGDRVVVSSQDGHLVGLATGYLCDVNRSSISCTLDRDLSKFSGLLFRLDNDEGVVGLSTHLTNLSRLMENCENSDRLRELVVDLRPPQFISNLSSVLPRDAKDTVANILKGLNKPQKQAMKKVLLSKDYTLIVGMPGTGKTTTICTLVRILHACGFSVLLTSYTHSAVDNILLKLKRFRVGFLRLGQAQKVHPDILPYTEESGRKTECHTLSELEQLYNKELVVATTCMGTKHPIFSRRRFDFCIIDEASQISQPVCLGPLFYAKRFVLVGDHQQLPPIVQNQEARSLGMDESLFKRLEHHSEAVVQLNVQYRMNRQIMSLSNSLMYGGRLECGSERTALALLSLPFLLSVQSELSSHFETCPERDLAWIQAALLPSNPVCFLDSSLVPALESVEQGGVSNHTEAALIHMLLTFLIKAGCRSSDIGVIAPYRRQLKIISALLQSPVFSGVEVNTVDRYQGRDKSVIVLSFVRSTTEEGNLGELLKDWRRLNVAVTRAKHKLLMVGSGSTLRRYAPLEKLLSHLQQENMIIQLPPAAHKALPSMHL